jgi:hypothetical protein
LYSSFAGLPVISRPGLLADPSGRSFRPDLTTGPSDRPFRPDLAVRSSGPGVGPVRSFRSSGPSIRLDLSAGSRDPTLRPGLAVRPSSREKSITRARSRRFREQTEPGFNPFRVQPCRDIPRSGRVTPPSPPGTAAILSLRSRSSKQEPCPCTPFMKSPSPATRSVTGVGRVRRALVGASIPA